MEYPSIKKGKRVIESGDLFEVHLQNDRKGYFQFLYKDDSFLAGHLIRAFLFEGTSLQEFNGDDVTCSGVMFFGFTRIFEGIQEGLWSKVGNSKLEANFEPPLFRITRDTNAYVERSLDWYVWRGDFAKATKIGALTEEYQNLPFSAIVSPSTVVEWFELGRQHFRYLPK